MFIDFGISFKQYILDSSTFMEEKHLLQHIKENQITRETIRALLHVVDENTEAKIFMEDKEVTRIYRVSRSSLKYQAT